MIWVDEYDKKADRINLITASSFQKLFKMFYWRREIRKGV
jgi:hypothetical protein